MKFHSQDKPEENVNKFILGVIQEHQEDLRLKTVYGNMNKHGFINKCISIGSPAVTNVPH